MKNALLLLLTIVRPALLRLLSSMKFWTLVLGLLTTQAAKHGLEVDPETYWTIVGFFGLLLGGQAATDLGKARAEVETRNIQSGFVRLDGLLMVVFVCGLACYGLVACSWVKSETRAVAADVIDCTTSKALELAKEYGPAVELALRGQLSDGGRIDRGGLKALAKNFASDTGRCVLAREVARLLTPRGSDTQGTPLAIDTQDVAAAWEDVRVAELGGRVFRLGHL